MCEGVCVDEGRFYSTGRGELVSADVSESIEDEPSCEGENITTGGIE